MNSVNPDTEFCQFSNTDLRLVKYSEAGTLICSFRMHFSGLSHSKRVESDFC